MQLPYVDRRPMTPPTDDFREYIPEDTIVEQTGWRSTEQIVTSLQDAGRRLQAYRKGMFDPFDDEDEGEIPSPILRNPDIDFTDVDRAASIVQEEALQAAERVKRQKESLPVLETAPKASEPALDDSGKKV